MAINTLATETLFQRTLDKLAVQEAVTGWMDANAGQVIYSFRPLSGSYISQYHPRNPMSCLGRIGGLRGKSNFIEIQLFWKVKSSHKSSI